MSPSLPSPRISSFMRTIRLEDYLVIRNNIRIDEREKETERERQREKVDQIQLRKMSIHSISGHQPFPLFIHYVSKNFFPYSLSLFSDSLSKICFFYFRFLIFSLSLSTCSKCVPAKFPYKCVQVLIV